MRGRKPKPVELKLLEGTYRKDRAPAGPPPASRAGTPHCPDWFDEERRTEWKKLARHYRAEGRSIQPHEVGIHATYVDTLVAIAQAKRELAVIEEAARKKASQLSLPGVEHALLALPDTLADKRKDLLRRVRGLQQELKTYAAELGLTPSARSRAGWGTPAPKAAEAEADPWQQLARSKGSG